MGRPLGRFGVALVLALVGLALLGMVPASLASKAASPPTPGTVCFSSDRGPVCVRRELTEGGPLGQENLAEALLEALLAGPTPAEQARGLRSAIPTEARLAEVECQSQGVEGAQRGGCGLLRARLRWPAEQLVGLDDVAVEETVRQIATTLEPLGWRDLHVEALDPVSGAYRPLSAFLAPLPAPRKPVAADGDDPLPSPVDQMGLAGQPTAYAQGQPQGALSGKTIYISAGHGWLWNDTYGWRTQRPPYPRPPYVGPIIEDHNNAEAVNQYLLQYLWNAGAMVWPVRERDMNDGSVIVNDDDLGPGYQETGTWFSSLSSGYDLDQPGDSYRYATVVAGPATATATWTAELPADGQYAVYVWYRPASNPLSSNRASDAHYTVHHAGGQTVVTVDQTYHGLTWHYIGTFAFRASSGARVTLSNESSETGKVVIADAVRIGGGLFSDLAGIETDAGYAPDKPWWEVAALYYSQRQGLDPAQLARFNDVIARPIYARWEHAGTGDEAVYVSWHSNGLSGYQTTASGTTSYIHNDTPTEGSAALQAAVHTELVSDIRLGWDAGWLDRGKRALDLGELRELWDDEPGDRMPGVLLEVAFHDHPGDTDALKEPRFNMLAARAVYQGIVKYFAQQDGQPARLLPEPPTRLRLVNAGAGTVMVHWAPPAAGPSGLAGDPPLGYRVYTSSDGFGWSDGIAVAGTSHALTQLAQGQLVFVRVASINEGGESFPTETLAARVGTPGGVLLVNGFDRLNRFALIPELDPVEGTNMRMTLGRMNRYDYVIHHGNGIGYRFDGAANEVVADGLLDLNNYRIVDWILGEEASADETLSTAERTRLRGYLDGGGALLISGAELGWDLDDLGRDPGFYHAYLGAAFAGDDAGTYAVVPAAGGPFDGLGQFRFDAPAEYDVDYPDQLLPYGSSEVALTYSGGAGGVAAVYDAQGCRRVVNAGFPFETIWPAVRDRVIARAMAYLGVCLDGPHTVIVTPAAGSGHLDVPVLRGLAWAAADVERVEVSLFRVPDDPQGPNGPYWSGSAWVDVPWHAAIGTETWSFPMPPTMEVGRYEAQARLWDADGLSDALPATVQFAITAPRAFVPLVLVDSGVPLGVGATGTLAGPVGSQ